MFINFISTMWIAREAARARHGNEWTCNKNNNSKKEKRKKTKIEHKWMFCVYIHRYSLVVLWLILPFHPIPPFIISHLVTISWHVVMGKLLASRVFSFFAFSDVNNKLQPHWGDADSLIRWLSLSLSLSLGRMRMINLFACSQELHVRDSFLFILRLFVSPILHI